LCTAKYVLYFECHVHVNIVFYNCISVERAGNLKRLRYRYYASKNRKFFFRHTTCMCRISGTQVYSIFVEELKLTSIEDGPCDHKSLPLEQHCLENLQTKFWGLFDTHEFNVIVSVCISCLQTCWNCRPTL